MWFSNFFENAFVSRVNRRICIRMARFWRSAKRGKGPLTYWRSTPTSRRPLIYGLDAEGRRGLVTETTQEPPSMNTETKKAAKAAPAKAADKAAKVPTKAAKVPPRQAG
jgi:hypothetical protein